MSRRQPCNRLLQRKRFLKLKLIFLPWRRGLVVSFSALVTEDPEFESRQGVRCYIFVQCTAVVCDLK
jgi:hypothetical protein